MSKENIVFQKLDTPEVMEYTTVIDTDRQKVKYIKRIETLCRQSMEYQDYIAFLKDYVDMKHCAFFTGVENQEGSRVRIEIHHEPLTLFDIVSVVVNKYIEEGLPLNDLYITDEVMDLHYKNMVGLIPLSKTVHQAVHHSNDLIVPIQLVYGDFKSFLNEYDDYLSDEIIDKIERKIDMSKSIKSEMYNKLNPKFVYLNIDGYQIVKRTDFE